MGDVMMNKKSSGFTLIELMVVVIIVAIFASVAIPSYQQYVRRANASLAEQEMLRFATLLERHKARSFSYKNLRLLRVYCLSVLLGRMCAITLRL